MHMCVYAYGHTRIRNLVPRAHVPFGQHQDTCLGADQKARGLWERDWRIRIYKVP